MVHIFVSNGATISTWNANLEQKIVLFYYVTLKGWSKLIVEYLKGRKYIKNKRQSVI